MPCLPGFVVNRLLFPYLFGAVRLLEESGIEPQAVDECMKLGAGHPMGPLALLDFVGPGRVGGDRRGARTRRSRPECSELIEAGKLGRKSGAGFYEYS